MPEGPKPSSESVANRMRRTKKRDTQSEMALRSELHRRGFRYHVDRAISGVTRGRPDVSFPTEQIAVFVDGCFWHSCPQHASTPASNRDWWVRKLSSNVKRDERHSTELGAAGWVVLRFWEHENPLEVADRVQRAVLEARQLIDRPDLD